MNPHYHRGALLWKQKRYSQAESEFRADLKINPDSSSSHMMLGMCLGAQKRYTEARLEIIEAIRLDPNSAYPHYSMAHLAQNAGESADAMSAIQEAIRLDPTNPDYHAVLAVLYLNKKEWAQALASAEIGLRFNPRHIDCDNTRSAALTKLNQSKEAEERLDASLAGDPANSMTHAHRGWAYLESGDPKNALEHFTEALRLNPQNDWARRGLVNAMKARNFIYGHLLPYFLWLARLKGKYQAALVLGSYLGTLALVKYSDSNADIFPWLLPFRAAYVIFALVTLLADPLFDFFLRLTESGRLVLTPGQVRASNSVAACLGVGLIFAILSLLPGVSSVGVKGSFVFGFIAIPISAVFRCAVGLPRWAMASFAAVIGYLGLMTLLSEVIHFWPLSQSWIGSMKLPDTASAFRNCAYASFPIAYFLIALQPRRALLEDRSKPRS
ncbi:MAG TPA: tetratricopeptide repeat protein [Candidatus Limnocylindria bacterium]|nr:tetratricopeptide repeat protein [Candidatus Limnocylindria bacterium]